MEKTKGYPKSTQFFDWLVILLAGSGTVGIYIDGWAHTHLTNIETFFTLWHAVFYGSFFALELVYLSKIILNSRK
jgi:hypothetical protein